MYTCKIILHAYKLTHVYMQNDYVYMQDDYIYMQDNYVYIIS